MTLLLPILLALLPLFALIGLGYALREWSVLHHEHVPVLNGLVLQVLLPASITRALLQAPALSPTLMTLPVLLFVAEMVVLAGCWLLSKVLGLSRKTTGALMLAGAFGNTSFLGYPLTQALLPHRFPATVVMDQFGMMLALYPIAAVLGAWSGAGQGEGMGAALLRFARGPLFLSILVGLALRQIPVPPSVAHQAWAIGMGSFLWQCLTYLSQATTPIVLLALGVALQPRAGGASSAAIVGVSVLKMLVCPIAIWLMCRAAGIAGDLRTVAVLEAAMPSAVLAAVLSGQHGLDGRFAVRAIFLTTALSAITVPLLIGLLR